MLDTQKSPYQRTVNKKWPLSLGPDAPRMGLSFYGMEKTCWTLNFLCCLLWGIENEWARLFGWDPGFESLRRSGIIRKRVPLIRRLRRWDHCDGPEMGLCGQEKVMRLNAESQGDGMIQNSGETQGWGCNWIPHEWRLGIPGPIGPWRKRCDATGK